MATWASVKERLDALRAAGVNIESDHWHKLEAVRLARLLDGVDAMLLYSKDVEDDNTVVLMPLRKLEGLIAAIARTLTVPMQEGVAHAMQREE